MDPRRTGRRTGPGSCQEVELYVRRPGRIRVQRAHGWECAERFVDRKLLPRATLRLARSRPKERAGTAADAFVFDLRCCMHRRADRGSTTSNGRRASGLSVAGSAIDETGDPIRFLSIVLDSGARDHAISVSVPRAWNAALFMPAVDVLFGVVRAGRRTLRLGAFRPPFADPAAMPTWDSSTRAGRSARAMEGVVVESHQQQADFMLARAIEQAN